MKYSMNVGLLVLIFLNTIQGCYYEKRVVDSHVIHIATFDPRQYEMKFVKAHDTVIGKETVAQMANRSGAIVAVTGGFYEEGNGQDGMPAGTCVIDGLVFALRTTPHDCLMQDKNQRWSILSYQPCLGATIYGSSVPISKINQQVEGTEIALYTSAWGKTTLTDCQNRVEVVFDKNYQRQYISKTGNTIIPEDGYVLSFSKCTNLEYGVAQLNSIDFDSIPQNALMGLPMLVQHGNILQRVINNTSLGHKFPYARVAVGLKPDGTIVVVHVENAYTQDIKNVVVGEIEKLLRAKAAELIAKYRKKPWQLTLAEVKEVVEREYQDTSKSVGLTMVELAQLMVELGCTSAINFCGGKSATLWMVGHSECNEKASHKAVSTAIVFVKK